MPFERSHCLNTTPSEFGSRSGTQRDGLGILSWPFLDGLAAPPPPGIAADPEAPPR